jgi:hypothetical protein
LDSLKISSKFKHFSDFAAVKNKAQSNTASEGVRE